MKIEPGKFYLTKSKDIIEILIKEEPCTCDDIWVFKTNVLDYDSYEGYLFLNEAGNSTSNDNYDDTHIVTMEITKEDNPEHFL